MNILHSIITHKTREVEKRKRDVPLKALAQKIDTSTRSLKDAIQGRANNKLHLIAEIKKASPSEGLLRSRLEEELEEIVAIYNAYASAISIVTDQKFFQGSLEWIKTARQHTTLPILCKDFIIDEYQIYEARMHGADAILLIAAALDKTKLAECIHIARTLGMDSLVEVHTQEEIKTALNAGAKIIGINNRDLATFHVSLATTVTLARSIPKEALIVSESGFQTKEGIEKVSGIADAVLIGTSLMKSNDIREKMKNLGFLKAS